eukprot:scaffold65618_cov60-Phaeocystis_antarctica.AAC.4
MARTSSTSTSPRRSASSARGRRCARGGQLGWSMSCRSKQALSSIRCRTCLASLLALACSVSGVCVTWTAEEMERTPSSA